MAIAPIGLHSMPIAVVTSLRTTPRGPSRAEAALELAGWTLLQHWTGPVLHWTLGPSGPPKRLTGVAVAAARVAAAKRVVKVASLNCMVAAGWWW